MRDTVVVSPHDLEPVELKVTGQEGAWSEP